MDGSVVSLSHRAEAVVGTQRVLLVDDEPNILASLKRELKGWAAQNDVSIVVAESGAAALAVLADGGDPVAVIVSDVRMPEMKGTELLLRVRQEHPGIVTMLLTGYADLDEVVDGIKAGIFSYMLKPWKQELLEGEVGRALRLYRLQDQERVRQDHLRRELAEAGQLQRALLAVTVPSSERLTFSVTYEPMPEFQCGGDFFDVILAEPDRYFFVVGDVAGHGVRAALITAVLHSLIHSDYLPNRSPEQVAPGDFLTRMNGRIARDLQEVTDMLLTCAACDIDGRTRRFRYANGGHPCPVLIHAGAAVPIRHDGLALGITRENLYTEAQRTLEPGDRILLYTDGLLEVGQGSASDGLVRLLEVASRAAEAEPFNGTVLRDVLSAAGASALTDDLAMVSIRIR
jgi:phosphoserine phosphatase RsbU/P